MELWLILRYAGGLMFAIAHRYIVRRAWQESWSLGLSSALVPGVSFVFAFLYRADLGRALLAQVAGVALAVTGFALGITSQLAGDDFAEREAQREESAESINPAEALRSQLQAGKRTMEQVSALKTAHDAEAQELEETIAAGTPAAAAPAAATATTTTAAPAATPPDVARWYAALVEQRKRLNWNDAAAVARFNADVARYHVAKQAAPAGPKRDELKPLNDQLKPLSNSLKPLAPKPSAGG